MVFDVRVAASLFKNSCWYNTSYLLKTRRFFFSWSKIILLFASTRQETVLFRDSVQSVMPGNTKHVATRSNAHPKYDHRKALVHLSQGGIPIFVLLHYSQSRKR